MGWLNFQTSGVETITLIQMRVPASLNTYATGMNNLVLKVDAVYNIRTMTLTTKSLDMSDLTSDGNFVLAFLAARASISIIGEIRERQP